MVLGGERRRAAEAAIQGAPRRRGPIVRIPSVARDLLVLIAVFVVVSALAGLLGAANLGTALTFGTIAFTAVLVGMMLLRDRDA